MTQLAAVSPDRNPQRPYSPGSRVLWFFWRFSEEYWRGWADCGGRTGTSPTGRCLLQSQPSLHGDRGSCWSEAGFHGSVCYFSFRLSLCGTLASSQRSIRHAAADRLRAVLQAGNVVVGLVAGLTLVASRSLAGPVVATTRGGHLASGAAAPAEGSAKGAASPAWRHVPVALPGNVNKLPGRMLLVTEARSGLRSLTALLALAFTR